MIFREDYSLKENNTFAIHALCRWFVEYDSQEELIHLLQTPLLNDYPFYHIGGGSNLLFTKNYDGVILHSAIRGIRVEEEDEDTVCVAVGAGVVWDDFVSHCVEQGWYGAENLSGIPGEAGASAVQNVGAYGVEVKDLIEEVRCVAVSSAEAKVFKRSECGYDYRKSNFKGAWKGDYIVVEVVYRLSKQKSFTLSYGALSNLLDRGYALTLGAVRERVIAIRDAKLPDPRRWGNGGSFFMNPVVPIEVADGLKAQYESIPLYSVDDMHRKISAAWLIEQCGWKEANRPHVGVCPTQSLVIINKGSASAFEIVDFASEIQTSVKAKFGIELVPEVIYL